jgi:hypothetical protein
MNDRVLSREAKAGMRLVFEATWMHWESSVAPRFNEKKKYIEWLTFCSVLSIPTIFKISSLCSSIFKLATNNILNKLAGKNILKMEEI